MDCHFSYDGRILRLPFPDSTTGEQVGPLVFSHQVTQIDATYQKNLEGKRQAFDRLFETIDQDQKALPQDIKRSAAIVLAFYTAESDYKDVVAAKNARVLKMYQDKDSQRTNKRLENAQKVYGKLQALLSDYDHKHLVLDCY
jgi:hypothetical protein